MAEVRLRFSADIKDLQKGVERAEKEVKDLAGEVKRATGSNTDYARSATAASNALASTSRTSGAARNALVDLNRVVSDAPFGFVAVQNNIDQLAGSFGNLVRQSGGVRGAFSALAAAFSGPAGILTLVSLASSAYLVFGDTIAEAFNKGSKAAREAQGAIRDAAESLINVNIAGQNFDINSIEDLRAVVERSRTNVAGLTKEFNAAKAAQRGLGVGQFGQTTVVIDQSQRKANQDRLDLATKNLSAEQAVLDTLEAQLAQAEGILEARRRLAGLGLGSNVDIDTGGLSIPGADDIVDDTNLKQIADDFVSYRQDAIRANIEAASSYDAVTAALQREAEASIATIQAQSDRQVQQELELNNLFLREQAMERFNTQLGIGGVLFAQLGSSAAGVLAEMALGFTNVESGVDALRQVVRGLVRDLVAAAAKAAILSVLFPGAGGAAGGGFGGFFRQALGIPALANGGIVNRPTLSLIGEAGPEAVVPLNKLQSMGGARKLEATTLRIAGGDLLIAIRDAQKTSGRTIGSITLE